MSTIGKAGDMTLASITKRITPKEWMSYKEYISGSGYTPESLDHVEGIIELKRQGVLTHIGEYDIVNTPQVYLTKTWFDRMSPAEAMEVEEEIREAQRGDEFGSW